MAEFNSEDILKRLRLGKAVKQSEFTYSLSLHSFFHIAQALEDRYIINKKIPTLVKARDIYITREFTEEANTTHDKILILTHDLALTEKQKREDFRI